MTFDEYADKVIRQYEINDLRFGQTAWNVLHFHKRHLLGEIPSGIDPFYKDENILEFKKWVREHWDDPI